jgi:predicted restriction endonuclease
MAPALLPAAIAADLAGVEPAEQLVRTIVEASGLLVTAGAASADNPAAARARRAATSLVRDARFSGRVLDAYGRRCAMCGLGLSLVQGAHIYPASAPGSKDEPWNGLSLCANHHVAFDRNMIAVLPGSMRIVFRADVIEEATEDPAIQAFVDGTLEALLPAAPGASPRRDMFVRRYAHYGDSYAWLPAD